MFCYVLEALANLLVLFNAQCKPTAESEPITVPRSHFLIWVRYKVIYKVTYIRILEKLTHKASEPQLVWFLESTGKDEKKIRRDCPTLL